MTWLDLHPFDFVRPGKKNLTLELGQLSDGFRTHMAMVIDLTRRMAECNPLPEGEREQPNFGHQSRAVVLIDEVDAHLHPSWQKTVLRGLLAAFPLAQFFVTTHSPLVLGAERDAKIWELEEGKVSLVGQTYGKTSDVILADYQETLPLQDELQRQFDKVRELLRQQRFEEAAALIGELESIVEPDRPDLIALRTRLQVMSQRATGSVKSSEKPSV